MLGLNETIDELAMANSVPVGMVMSCEGHLILRLMVKGRKRGRRGRGRSRLMMKV